MISQSGNITSTSYSLQYCAISNTGMVRGHNEDLYLVLESHGIFCVADGAGGQGRGDMASYLTIKGIKDVVLGTDDKSYDDTIPLGEGTVSISDDSTVALPTAIIHGNSSILVPAIHHANDLCRKSELENIASTIVSCHFQEEQLQLAHVGDSRIYRFKDNQLQQLTKDHSLVNYLFDKGEITEDEKLTHPKKNVILKAVGAEDAIQVSVATRDIEEGELYLLCSDGLTGMVSDNQITQLIQSNKDELENLCKLLVQTANDNGGRDNITIILIKVEK